MESIELNQIIQIVKANILELKELIESINDDPILKAKVFTRLVDQVCRLEILENTPRF